VDDVGCGDAARDHVVGENGGQLLAVLGLDEVLDRTRWQLGEGRVCRREDREGAGAAERVLEASRLNGGDEGGELLRPHRRVDDVRGGLAVAGLLGARARRLRGSGRGELLVAAGSEGEPERERSGESDTRTTNHGKPP